MTEYFPISGALISNFVFENYLVISTIIITICHELGLNGPVSA